MQRPTGSDCAARLGAATTGSRTSRVTSAYNAAGRKSQCVIDSEQLNELSLCGDEMNSTTSKAKAKWASSDQSNTVAANSRCSNL